MAQFPPRHAISRARFFLKQADGCGVDQRDGFEAYLEAAIIFGRTALHRVQSEHDKHPKWKAWWNRLLTNDAVSFFRQERDWILKEGPPKVGQVIRIGQPMEAVADLYYYEDPNIRAATTVAQHLNAVEHLIVEAQSLFAG